MADEDEVIVGGWCEITPQVESHLPYESNSTAVQAITGGLQVKIRASLTFKQLVRPYCAGRAYSYRR